MDIRLKRAYEPASAQDGLRILVDRLWPRGVSREKAHLDAWLKDIAPTAALRSWFGHDPEKWDEFRSRYHAELDANPKALEELRAATKGASTVTLVYGAKDEAHNDAVVLQEYLQRRR